MTYQDWCDSVDRALSANRSPYRCAQLDPSALMGLFNQGLSPVVAAQRIAAGTVPAPTAVPVHAPVPMPIGPHVIPPPDYKLLNLLRGFFAGLGYLIIFMNLLGIAFLLIMLIIGAFGGGAALAGAGFFLSAGPLLALVFGVGWGALLLFLSQLISLLVGIHERVTRP